jgi:hypothetical protein
MRMRVTVKKSGTLADELRLAAEVRRVLWARAPVGIDPDNPLHGIHRDEQNEPILNLPQSLPRKSSACCASIPFRIALH